MLAFVIHHNNFDVKLNKQTHFYQPLYIFLKNKLTQINVSKRPRADFPPEPVSVPDSQFHRKKQQKN